MFRFGWAGKCKLMFLDMRRMIVTIGLTSDKMQGAAILLDNLTKCLVGVLRVFKPGKTREIPPC